MSSPIRRWPRLKKMRVSFRSSQPTSYLQVIGPTRCLDELSWHVDIDGFV